MRDFFNRPKVVRFAPIGVALLALAALLINPIGYVGGGSDDVHYLTAARCWVQHSGMCVPDSHWAGRWPAVAPIAAGIALFGEGRVSIGLGTLAGWVGSFVLVVILGRLWFDRAVGMLAAILFAMTPLVSAWATQPSVDLIELAFQLAGLALATAAFQRQSVPLAIVAGVAAALAVQARETSLVFCGVAALAWLWLDRDRRDVLLWAVAGFAGATAVEMIAYAAATGDPLFRYRLAIGHVTIPSRELAASVDTRESPLFNPSYIAGWRREMDIHWWWPADPWLNLLASPLIGVTLVAALLIAPFGWRNLSADWQARATGLIVAALLVAMALVYGLAVDPKPRMFFYLVASSALVIAAITIANWRSGRGLLPAAIVMLLVAAGLRILSITANTHAMESRAAIWVATYPGKIQVDVRTLASIMLVPGARALPATGRPLSIISTNGACEAFGTRVIDRIGGPPQGELCLIETAAR